MFSNLFVTQYSIQMLFLRTACKNWRTGCVSFLNKNHKILTIKFSELEFDYRFVTFHRSKAKSLTWTQMGNFWVCRSDEAMKHDNFWMTAPNRQIFLGVFETKTDCVVEEGDHQQISRKNSWTFPSVKMKLCFELRFSVPAPPRTQLVLPIFTYKKAMT